MQREMLERAQHWPWSSNSSCLRHRSSNTYSSSQYSTVCLQTLVMAAYLSVVSRQWKAIVFLLLLCPKHKRWMLLISALQLPRNPISGDAAKGNVGGGTNAGFINSYAETEQWRNSFCLAVLVLGTWCFKANRHHILRLGNPEHFKGRRQKIWQQPELNWR